MRARPLAGLATLIVACSSSSGSGSGSLADAGANDGASADANAGTGPQAEGGGDASQGSGQEAGEQGDGASGPCSPTQLLCNGLCVPDDAVNCGTCGHDCTTLHVTTTPSCSAAGQCTFPALTCAAGWAHCSSNAGDGCEADLSQPAHCGSCTACVGGPFCSLSAGVYACNKATAVGAGTHVSFALFSNGTIDAWGADEGDLSNASSGQLGTGANDANSSVPTLVSNTTTATAVAVGDSHACALLSNGTVECWGDNYYGELGTDTTTANSETPIAVTGLSNVIAIAAGAVHTCALVSGGTVQCWGSNDYGELGNDTSALCNGSDMCSSAPVAVSNLTNVTAIAIGAETDQNADHTCALLGTGKVECWGFNQDGELGNGSMTTNGVAAAGPVSNVTNATAITGRAEGGCALISGGSVRCWGTNDVGQLGDGTTNDSPTSVAVSDLTDGMSLSVGPTGNSVCAVRSSGVAVCWGSNDTGQLGMGVQTEDMSMTPLPVSGLTNVSAIAVGSGHACALLATGNVECWGSDFYGELANATAMSDDNPAPLPVQW
jgi:alpha-tubulin suppressor-like RCC1 family protein